MADSQSNSNVFSVKIIAIDYYELDLRLRGREALGCGRRRHRGLFSPRSSQSFRNWFHWVGFSKLFCLVWVLWWLKEKWLSCIVMVEFLVLTKKDEEWGKGRPLFFWVVLIGFFLWLMVKAEKRGSEREVEFCEGFHYQKNLTMKFAEKRIRLINMCVLPQFD